MCFPSTVRFTAFSINHCFYWVSPQSILEFIYLIYQFFIGYWIKFCFDSYLRKCLFVFMILATISEIYKRYYCHLRLKALLFPIFRFTMIFILVSYVGPSFISLILIFVYLILESLASTMRCLHLFFIMKIFSSLPILDFFMIVITILLIHFFIIY